MVFDDFEEPVFDAIVDSIDTDDAVNLIGSGATGGYVSVPQAVGGLTAITIQYWADISANNYANDHRIFSSGATGESQVLLWSDNHDGLAFVIKTGASGRGRINSSYSVTGWVQVTGTWDGATGEMKMYANGVLLGTDNFAGDGQ